MSSVIAACLSRIINACSSVDLNAVVKKISELEDKILVEQKVKEGAENLLQLTNGKKKQQIILNRIAECNSRIQAFTAEITAFRQAAMSEPLSTSPSGLLIENICNGLCLFIS